MQGIAPLDDPRRDTAVDPRVEVLSSAGEWVDATEPLHRLWESHNRAHPELMRAGLLPADRDLSDADLARRALDPAFVEGRVGAGLGPAFASRLADLAGRRIALVPCAHGGTSLEQWSRSASTDTLYGSMLDRIHRATSRDGVTLRGILWYQGESDATLPRSHDYAERFARWVADVRADLVRPDLPVYVVQLGRFTGVTAVGDLVERSWDEVREAQRMLPRQVSASGVVSAVDLGLSDPIHVGTPGLARLGRRLATLAAEGSTGPDVDRVEYVGAASNGHLALRVRCTGVRGGWRAAEFLPGFRLTDREGVPVARLGIVDAHPDPADPSSIVLVTNPLLPSELAGVHVSYGQGFDPVCLAVDEADLPLPAFAAQPIVGVVG